MPAPAYPDRLWFAYVLSDREAEAQTRFSGNDNPDRALVKSNCLAIADKFLQQRELRWGQVDGDGTGITALTVFALKMMGGWMAARSTQEVITTPGPVVSKAMDFAEDMADAFGIS